MPGPVVGPAPGGLGILSNPIAGGALAGTPADPFATTLHVVPPPGGAVILYDGVNDVFSAYQHGRPGLPQHFHVGPRRERRPLLERLVVWRWAGGCACR